jgi:4-carboxymuconolactone decarboxylase
MTEHSEPSGAQKAFGDFAPALVELTDEVLFGQVWPRTELSPKQRSLVTVSVLAGSAPPSSSPTTSIWPSTTATPRPS